MKRNEFKYKDRVQVIKPIDSSGRFKYEGEVGTVIDRHLIDREKYRVKFDDKNLWTKYFNEDEIELLEVLWKQGK